ncbi:alpha-1,2-fucosyltransferase [Butyrivibrio sp. YAB3001]|uniref:alpha-1,2-fucosyltransferase n=1 Tax=Butyrivibrio sp. YAB3001 TaxID=1520812 RepID=UPI0008F658B3|nr:alpha-1,2-fucosyltransferase [Butyrivibrio sp. YAB3001]SFB94977.1 Glycosyl transferase family 11 [Butyrivibrio sp. YAB3001]
MNYVRVVGGLGNQMFQYTFSKFIEEVFGIRACLHLDYFEDIKSEPTADFREFGLDRMRTGFESVYGEVACSQIINEEDDWHEKLQAIDGLYFNGYWQAKKYYEYVKDIVRSDFELKDEYITNSMRSIVEEMQSTNSISLHIRRTDYIKENITLKDEYYYKAIDVLRQKIGKNRISVFAFSDDLDYADKLMNNLECESYTIMPIRPAYQDLYLMSKTKHHIIANSTFSWWGAVLGNSDDSLTVAPLIWFKDRKSPDIYMNDWILI